MRQAEATLEAADDPTVADVAETALRECLSLQDQVAACAAPAIQRREDDLREAVFEVIRAAAGRPGGPLVREAQAFHEPGGQGAAHQEDRQARLRGVAPMVAGNGSDRREEARELLAELERSRFEARVEAEVERRLAEQAEVTRRLDEIARNTAPPAERRSRMTAARKSELIRSIGVARYNEIPW